MSKSDLEQKINAAVAAWNNMTDSEREAMLKVQRESYVRGESNWPKPKFHFEKGVKIYDSIEDYHND